MRKLLLILLLTGCQKSPLESVGIKIKPVYERHLHQWSSENTGKTFGTAPSAYPGHLRTNTETIKGKVSIRGDLRGHWKGERKSFKFEANKGSYYKGMRELDFIIPEDKYFELEPLGYELARSLGILTPRWEFVTFSLNTKSQGVYLLLEKWTPESMERRGLPEGDIVREANAWLDVIRLGKDSRYKDVFFDKAERNPLALRPEIYRSMFQGPHAPIALHRFAEMLRSLPQNGTDEFIEKSEAVNWFVLMLVMGSYHGVLGDNLKWYYHPYERKFHLIPYDFLSEKLRDEKCPLGGFAKLNPWIAEWIKDKEFKTLVKRRLSGLFAENWPLVVIEKFYSRPDIKFIVKDGSRKKIILENVSTLRKVVESNQCFE